jgi:cytoskeletal protein RodZ
MDNQNQHSSQPGVISNNPVSLADEPTRQVVVSHFAEDLHKKQPIFHRFKLPMLISVLAIVLLSLGGGVYVLLYQHESKDNSGLTSDYKSTPVVTSLNQTPTPSPTTSSSTPATSPPTATTSKPVVTPVKTAPAPTKSSSSSVPTPSAPAPVVFSATASAPVFIDQGSYAATSGNNVGQCIFNSQQSYSVNGPGSISLTDFETTSDPNTGPFDGSGYGNQTFTQAGNASVANPQSFSTDYESHVIVSDYFQVINSANGQVLATSPTAQFDCP